MYGQTEATAYELFAIGKMPDKVRRIGIPIPGGKFELVDADGSVIEKQTRKAAGILWG